MKNTKTQERG